MPDCQTLSADPVCQLKRTLITAEDPNESFQVLLKGLLDAGRGKDVVDVVHQFMTKGTVAKQKLLIAALAFCTTYPYANKAEAARTKQAIYTRLPELCQIPSTLFMLLKYEMEFTPNNNHKVSFGRSKRHGISRWYNRKSPRDLAMTVTKYRRRSNWSHADLLRMAHVRPANKGIELVLKYATKGMDVVTKYMEEGDEKPEELKQVYEYLQAVEQVKKSRDEQEVARLVEKYRLMREHVPTWMMKSKEVWTALLQHMPLLAMIKNLNHFGILGLLDSSMQGNCVQQVVDKLHNEQHIRDARIHPMNILLALKAYERGRPDKSTKSQWKPSPEIVVALDAAFYKAFTTMEPTTKCIMLAIDASESMQYGNVLGCNLITPLVASAAMSMFIARSEPSYQIVALTDAVIPLNDVSPAKSLGEVCTEISRLKSDRKADFVRPIQWAEQSKKEIDVFIIFTDQRGGPTGTGDAQSTQTMQALQRYRDSLSRPNTRLVVVTLTSPDTSLIDESDPHVLHLAGFDAATPEIIRSFVLGELDSVPAG